MRIAVIYPKAVAIGLAALAVVVMSGWRSQPAPVEHALVPVGKFSVEVWRDPADGELALQWQGADSWTLVRGRRVFRMIKGRLAQLEVYAATADLWRRIRAEYGLSPDQVDSALRSGDEVGRPSLMDVPSLDRPSRPYLFVRDFGTKVSILRKAANFPVPAPGATLAGLQLADASLSQTRGPGRLVDSGYVASLFYSADPEHHGTGERQLAVEAASARSPAGDSYRQSFAASRRRLVGPGYDARLGESGPILRYHGVYVLVSLRVDLSTRQLRAVLRTIARS